MIFRNLKRMTEDLENKLVKYYNTLIDELNVGLSRLTFEDNFNAQIVEITLPANTEREVSHSLKVRPKYKIVLKQRGNGVIEDSTKSWDDKRIWLVNNSGNEITATIAILRG